jgi:hypothetical protein
MTISQRPLGLIRPQASGLTVSCPVVLKSVGTDLCTDKGFSFQEYFAGLKKVEQATSDSGRHG